MAFTAAVFTSLAVWGGPGPVSAPLLETGSVTDTASVSVSESVETTATLTASDTASVTLTESGAVVTLEANLTDLMPWGASGGYRDIGAKDLPAVADVDTTDTASISVSESAATEQLAEVAASDDAAVTATEGAVGLLQFEGLTTDLGVWCNPSTYREIGARPTLDVVELEVFDDALVSATEEPVDSQFVETSDTALVSLAESLPTVEVAVLGEDTASVSVSEAIELSIAGTFALDLTDTASVSLAEAVVLDASTDVTDDALVSVADVSTLDIDVEPTTATVDVSDSAAVSASDASELLVDPATLEVTDEAAVTLNEIVGLDISAGEIAITLDDNATIALIETATIIVVDGQIGYLTGTVTFKPALVATVSFKPGA